MSYGDHLVFGTKPLTVEVGSPRVFDCHGLAKICAWLNGGTATQQACHPDGTAITGASAKSLTGDTPTDPAGPFVLVTATTADCVVAAW